MGAKTAPATVVICCRLPARISTAEFADWTRLAERADAAISWVAAGDDLAALSPAVEAAGALGRIALEVDAATLSSRPSLRAALATARRTVGAVEAVVATAAPQIEGRGLLVAESVRTLCIERFEPLARGSRRPAPHGWPCRSAVWGLWEVCSAQPASGVFSRMLPWRASQLPPPGQLSVITLSATGTAASREIRGRLERVLGMVSRRRAKGPVQVPHLADIPDLIAGDGQGRAGSVLRAA
ncbi:MAG: hypothetical protein ACK54F_05960 [Planctomycetia bacterium]|jgi:hypothetical protein